MKVWRLELYVSVFVGAFSIVALGGWLMSTLDNDQPCVTPATVFIPAGPQVCPEEDSCRLDYDGTRWVIIPEMTP